VFLNKLLCKTKIDILVYNNNIWSNVKIKNTSKTKMKEFLVFLQVFYLLFNGLIVYGQKDFVSFETTNNAFSVCQGSVLGIIAIINPNYKNIKNFNWDADKDALYSTKKEIAKVNTSNAGNKKIKFYIILNNDQKLDTTIIVKVLPKPNTLIQISNNTITVLSENSSTCRYKWFFNDSLTNEFLNKPFKKPKPGQYKALVNDENGCISITNVIEIK